MPLKFLFPFFAVVIMHTQAVAQDYTQINHWLLQLENAPELDGTDRDTVRFEICLSIGDQYYRNVPDSALFWYAMVADTVFSETISVRFRARAHLNAQIIRKMGVMHRRLGNYNEAYTHYQLALKIFRAISNVNGEADCLNNLGNLSLELDDFDNAIRYFNTTIELFESVHDNQGIIKSLNNMANVYMRLGDYEKAHASFSELLLRINNDVPVFSRATYLYNMAYSSLMLGNYYEAMQYFEKSLPLFEEENAIAQILLVNEQLARMFMEVGRYQESLKYYNFSLELHTSAGDYEGIFNNLLGIGLVNAYRGNYPEALSCYEKAELYCEYTENPELLSSLFLNRGMVYYQQNNLNMAIEYYDKSLELAIENELNAIVSYCYNNLGIIMSDMGNHNKAVEYYQKAYEIISDSYDYAAYSAYLINMASEMEHLNDFEKFLYYHNENIRINNEAGSLTGRAFSLVSLAPYYVRLQQFDDAHACFAEGIAIYESEGVVMDLSRHYLNWALCFLQTDSVDAAMSRITRAREITVQLLKSNFSVLSESEKELYIANAQWLVAKIHAINLAYGEHSTELASLCYDNELLMKGLLLKSSRAIVDAVFESGDSLLVSSYTQLCQLRGQISELQSADIEGLKDVLSGLEREANEVERRLVHLSSEFAELQDLFSVSYVDVIKSLKPGEAAIEFVELRHRVNIGTIESIDSISYAALVLIYGDTLPHTIALCSGESLASLFRKPGIEAQKDIDEERGAIFKNEVIDFEACYKLIWEPIEPLLGNVKTVVLAPSGILHQISFAALRDTKKRLLSDKYTIRTVHSTHILADKKHTGLLDISSMALFGGVSYAADERLAEHLSQHYGVDADSLLQAFNSGVPQNTAAAWKFLPGTLSEVFHIADQLAANNREPILFTGAAASEEQFKKLTGSMAPQILHVATHGFAIPIESKKTAYQIFENSFVENNNPLFRTGLLLAGASRIWDKAPAIPGIEDGILTAYEVSNLDLRNTRLVVLSACETGLGDVKGSEGVYGLQRAFKMAGVPYVIASLWPVPDKETAVFMQLFYKNLLKTKDVRTAFAKTQKSMRKKYEPYYWAAFVLVE